MDVLTWIESRTARHREYHEHYMELLFARDLWPNTSIADQMDAHRIDDYRLSCMRCRIWQKLFCKS